MSFYPQPYKYQCGPFALKYGLVMLGKFENERDIAKKAGSSWWYGTDEIGLEKAAKSYGCNMKYFKHHSAKEAVALLKKHLAKGRPCLLSVDNWGHWFTVINEEKDKYVVVDSDLEKVIVLYSLSQLLKRWKFYDPETGVCSFDGYALTSKEKKINKARFSVEIVRYIMHNRNKQLAEKWDNYFNDLITICRPRRNHSKKIISFAEFLRRHEKLLIKEVAYWHGVPEHKELKKILKNMHFVAKVYDLVIYHEDQKKALVDLAILLMMYSCGKYGMENIY